MQKQILVFLFFCIVFIASDHIIPDDELNPDHLYNDNDIIHGVPKATRHFWLRFALSINQQQADSVCPLSAFGAVIVNYTSNQLMCAYNAFPAYFSDPSAHAEYQAIRNCSALFPGNGFNSEGFWNQLTLYATGEPCSMCTGAIINSRIGEVVWSVPVDVLNADGFTQMLFTSIQLNRHSSLMTPRAIIMGNVLQSEIEPYFQWQFNPSAPCPTGCIRSDGSCVPN